MFGSPKNVALLTILFGIGGGLLSIALADGDGVVLPVLLSFFGGVVLGTLVFARWRKTQSKRLFFSWLIVIYLTAPIAVLLGLAPEVSFILAGYGLALWRGIHLWERHLQKPLAWIDLDS